MWTPLPGRSKDYVASPKPNGYSSLHSALLLPPAGGERCDAAAQSAAAGAEPLLVELQARRPLIFES